MRREADRRADKLIQFLRDQGCEDPVGWVAAEIVNGTASVTKWLFLQQLWPGVIDGYMSNPDWIDVFIERSRTDPDPLFRDAGLAMSRMIETGISKEDISRTMRFAAYESVFSILSFIDEGYTQNSEGDEAEKRGWALVEIDEKGERTGRSLEGLHESILSLNPSRREKREK